MIIQEKLSKMSIKIGFKPIETEPGIIKGRDSMYLDEINYDYVNKKVELLVQTYDNVFQIICESYNFKLYCRLFIKSIVIMKQVL